MALKSITSKGTPLEGSHPRGMEQRPLARLPIANIGHRLARFARAGAAPPAPPRDTATAVSERPLPVGPRSYVRQLKFFLIKNIINTFSSRASWRATFKYYFFLKRISSVASRFLRAAQRAHTRARTRAHPHLHTHLQLYLHVHVHVHAHVHVHVHVPLHLHLHLNCPLHFAIQLTRTHTRTRTRKLPLTFTITLGSTLHLKPYSFWRPLGACGDTHVPLHLHVHLHVPFHFAIQLTRSRTRTRTRKLPLTLTLTLASTLHLKPCSFWRPLGASGDTLNL